MISCLAPDVTTSAAAQRAGLIRRAPVDDVTTYDPSDMEAPIIGAPIAGFTSGFVQTAAWLRLGIGALEDLSKYGALPVPGKDEGFWRETRLIWVVPENTPGRFSWPDEQVMALLDTWCGEKLLALTGLPLSQPTFLPLGPSGAAAAVQALASLGEGVRRIILLGTDSWLDPMSLAWLGEKGRLKAHDQPAGLCPGEAGAALLVERAADVRKRGGTAQATLLGAAVVPTGEPFASPVDRAARASDAGNALAGAIVQALASASVDLPFRGDIYLDLNGEEWRAMVWGHAQTHLVGVLAANRVQLPSRQLGDVGAASAVVALCLATRAFVRRYSGDRRTVVCSVSDDGRCGAIVLGTG